jgi:GrpB-like predicted nucleotidyltransferase (UPF0157 family)
MIEPDFEHGERLLFRNYLRAHPDVTQEAARVAIARP